MKGKIVAGLQGVVGITCTNFSGVFRGVGGGWEGRGARGSRWGSRWGKGDYEQSGVGCGLKGGERVRVF